MPNSVFEKNKVSPTSSEVTTRTNSTTESEFKVYGERWLMLITITSIIWSNIMQWVAYSALIDQTNMYYCGPDGFKGCTSAFLSNQIYQVVAMIVSVIGMYCATIFGILPTLRIAALTNLLGSIIRLIASIPTIQSFVLRQSLMLTGTAVSAIAQMYFVVSSKVAESWFFAKHRASANVACSNSMELGVVVGTFLPSLILPSNSNESIIHSWSFFVLNSILSAVCIIPMILTLISRRSLPKTPPSLSSEHECDMSVTTGIWICLKNPQFLIQSVIYAINYAIANGLIYTSNAINYQGYDLKGYPIAIATAVCIVIAYVVGIIADKTRKFKEITIINVIVMALTVLGLRLYLIKTYTGWYDSVVVCSLLSLAMSTCSVHTPIGNEMGVETTFPVHESISTGVLNTFGQAWLFAFYFILYALQDSTILYSDNKKPGENWEIALDFWVAIAIFNAIVAVFLLRPKYNRLMLENEREEERK